MKNKNNYSPLNNFIRRNNVYSITSLSKEGLDFIWKTFKGKSKFKADKEKYSKMNRRSDFEIDNKKLRPIVTDWYRPAGEINGYFYQDLWAARKVFASKVENHYDIGSSVRGFVLAALSITNVTLIDIRPLDVDIKGLNFIQADATTLDGINDNSILSLSSLCALEHFGLGRYGDPIDPEACFKAFKSIQRVMKPGGKVYISVPIASKDRVEFNSDRYFSPQTIISEFDKLNLVELTILKDEKVTDTIFSNNTWRDRNADYNGGDAWGFFEFEKK